MHERFRPFSELLHPRITADELPEPAEIAAPQTEPQHTAGACEAEVLAEVRLFRAHLEEFVERSVCAVLDDVAAIVLARELQLAPADIAAIVRRAIDRFAAEEPLRIRAAPADVSALADAAVPVVADATLRGGDAIVELRDGTVDVRLGVRFASIRQEFAA